jgi:hypothetical protein
MLNTEISSLMEEKGKVYGWATKVETKRTLDSEEREMSEVISAWAHEIGTKGSDNNHELANFIVKIVQPEVYDVPDELLDSLFDRGNIGEFDDYKTIETPKNNLVAHDAAKGGNVDKSYIDLKAIAPTWKHKQVETEISYVDLRKNGFKTVANMTVFAKEALQNAMFYDIFSQIDAAISGGEQLITAGGSTPTAVAMDALSLYLIDRGENPLTVSLSKYAQAIANMSGRTTFMSDSMKDEYNRYGLVNFYSGVKIGTISGAKKTGAGQLLLPDKRIFGIAGKIGNLDMRGDIRVYETMDNQNEKVHLKITGFEFGTAIRQVDKIAKIVLA